MPHKLGEFGAIASGMVPLPLPLPLLPPLLLLLLLPMPTPISGSSEVADDPLLRLASVFGVRKVPDHLRASVAPLYLSRLYESLSDRQGVSVRAVPYSADSVVAYADTAQSSQQFYKYNVTRASYQRSITFADLHMYRLRPKTGRTRRRRDAAGRVIKLKLYQVTHPRRARTPFGNILISQRLLTVSQLGWVVFDVSQSAKTWMRNSNAANFGLALFAYYTNGDRVPDDLVRFVQRGENRDLLQPSLMIYSAERPEGQTRDSRQRMADNALNRAFESHDPNRYLNVYTQKFKVVSRTRRSSSGGVHRAGKASCRRYPMYVDFAKVGWRDWIISPAGFNAYLCMGHCPFPLGQQYQPSNHAVVQSIVSHLGTKAGVRAPKPSCVPSRLSSINMLYYDDSSRVVLKQYDDMVALACGCR